MILDGKGKRAALLSWLTRSHAASIYVPTLALDEVSHVPEKTFLERLTALGEIYQHAPGRVFVAADLVAAVRAEIERRQSTIVKASFGLETLVGTDRETLKRNGLQLRELARQAAANKDAGFRIDRSGADEYARVFGAPLDPATAVALIEEPTPAQGLHLGIEPAVMLSGGRLTAEQILAAPRRYPVANLLAHFAYRQVLANSVAHDAGHLALGIFRTKTDGGRGAWYDTGIAAVSALADIVISEDAGFADRCKWLADRGQLHFKTTTLVALLSLK